VGVLVAVAQGRVSLAQVRTMLETPSVDSWDPRAVTAPPHGLYLVDVAYHEQDLQTDAELTANCDDGT
jgi:tRNA U38,U39,U40 pseudouridine synthase TruA